jgi:phosphate-selective porin OprO and OprP
MKKTLLLLFIFCSLKMSAQNTNELIDLLIANKNITQEQADSLRAESAIKQQDAEANKKSFLITAARQIQISGYTQLRYQNLDERHKYNGFDLRRARLDFKGKISPFMSIRLQTELADKPKLLDAYAEIKLNDYFNITLGQFGIPFSMENLASITKLELIDYSQPVDALTARGKDVIGNQNGRDIGIQLGGALIKSGNVNVVEYRLGIFNGSGINVADTANEAKDVVGRIIVNPVKGLSLGTSYYNGFGKAVKPTTEYKGRSQVRNRFGLEIAYTTNRLVIKSEFIQGKDAKAKRAGWYILAGYYVIPAKLQLITKFDTYDPNISVSDNITQNYVVGTNFNFNAWSRIQASYTFREEEGPSANNNSLSVQYQIGF